MTLITAASAGKDASIGDRTERAAMAAGGEMLKYALAWAARNFKVFPLRAGTKLPFKDWPWTERATTDPDTLNDWWGAGQTHNIGVLTDGLIVVDVDVKEGAGGRETLERLALPRDSLTVRTPSGGLHLYFSGPDRANSQGRLGPGIDTRSFHGYVVAPGSRTPTGVYELVNDAPVRAAPPHLVAALDAPKDRVAGKDVIDESPAAIELAVHRLTVELPAPEKGSRNTALYEAACAVKSIGISEARALDLIRENWNTRLAEPLDEAEIEKTTDSAYRNGSLPIGEASPLAHFAGLDLSQFALATTAAPALAAASSPMFPIYRDGDDWRASVDWLFYDLLPARGTGFLGGAPGSAKTFVAVDLAVSVAAGRPFFGVTPDRQGGVLYLASEDASGLRKRLAAARGQSPALPISIIDVGRIDAKDRQRALANLLRAECDEIRRRFGVAVLLAFVDTMSASGLLGEENGAEDGSRAVAALKAIADLIGGFAIGVHHPPKAGKGLRGSGALEGNADTILEVTREPEAQIRHLSLEKSREAVAPRPVGSFELRKVALGVDAEGRELTTCMVVAARALPKSAKPPAQLQTFMQALDHALIGEGEPVDGVKAVRKDVVQDQFREIGPPDSGYRSRQFNACLAWAIGQGHVRRIEHFGRDYLATCGDFELPARG